MDTLLKVLIIEDREDDALLAIGKLRRAGYDVIFERVDTPETMTEAMDHESWDIIISDHRMPRFDSLAALKIARDKRPYIPFIIVSGTIGEEEAVNAMRVGAHDYLMKGNLARLAPAVERELREADERRAHHQAEEALRLQATIMGHVAEGVFLVGLDDLRIKWANERIEKMFGYEAGELIGAHVDTVNAPTDLTPTETRISIVDVLEETGEWHGEVRNIKQDGTHFWCYSNVSIFEHPDHGKVLVSVHTDITERKRAEEEHSKLEDQLRQSQKMEAVGLLAGGIAHDFNNLLQAILGYGDLALVEAGEANPVSAHVKKMLKAGNSAKTLVRQLLAFSRQQVLDMKDINLNDSIADVMKMLRRVIGEHIKLNFISGHDLGTVNADPGQIELILMNLCVNARDAMGENGQITIETENVRIDEAYCELHAWAKPGRYVLLSVTDTGCGMDKETIGKAFQPFFTTKGVGKGTGLGLSTVYGLVKQHQGMVHVYSEVGKGTTFKIYLPLVERSASAVGHKIIGPVPGGTETILLAEDEETLLALTKTTLEHAGYTVLIAHDGVEALGVFELHAVEIDMALLDVVMPNLGGPSVYEHIRKARPGVRVLFTSGYSMNAVHTNFVLKEGLAIIQKPYQRDDMLRKVREVLDGAPLGI